MPSDLRAMLVTTWLPELGGSLLGPDNTASEERKFIFRCILFKLNMIM